MFSYSEREADVLELNQSEKPSNKLQESARTNLTKDELNNLTDSDNSFDYCETDQYYVSDEQIDW